MPLSSKTFTTCSNCDEVSEAEEPLYMCVMQNCSKYGEPLCEDCGISAHKRKNHKFILTQDHIKPINLTVMQQNINNESVIMQQTFAPQHNIKAESERAKIAISTASLANPMIIAAHASHTYAFYNGNSILSWLNWINQPDTMKATIQELTNNPLLSQQQLAGVGAVLIAAQETIIHTRRFMNGDIATYKEYGYHMAKGLAGTIGYALANATAVSYGVTYGTLIGGPIGGIIGSIIAGMAGGIIGGFASRSVFEMIFPADFIENEQMVKKKMILDSLKLFGFTGIEDIKNVNIFNEQELKKTYRTLAKRYHPDKNGGSHQKFQEIVAAFGVLLNLLEKKNKTEVVEQLKEIRAIKWRNAEINDGKRDIKELSKILSENKLMHIVDICNKYDKRLSMDFLCTMRKDAILDTLKTLSEDSECKYNISAIDRTQFVNIIEKWKNIKHMNWNVNEEKSIEAQVEDDIVIVKWSLNKNIDLKGKDEEKEKEVYEDEDDIEYDEIEELRDELRKNKLFDVVEICKEYDDEYSLESLLEYTKQDILEVINEINNDKSNEYKISVSKKNKFAKIICKFAAKEPEQCLSK